MTVANINLMRTTFNSSTGELVEVSLITYIARSAILFFASCICLGNKYKQFHIRLLSVKLTKTIDQTFSVTNRSQLSTSAAKVASLWNKVKITKPSSKKAVKSTSPYAIYNNFQLAHVAYLYRLNKIDNPARSSPESPQSDFNKPLKNFLIDAATQIGAAQARVTIAETRLEELRNESPKNKQEIGAAKAILDQLQQEYNEHVEGISSIKKMVFDNIMHKEPVFDEDGNPGFDDPLLNNLYLFAKNNSDDIQKKLDDPCFKDTITLFSTLTEQAARWKAIEKAYLPDESPLNEDDTRILFELCNTYPEAARLLISNDKLAESFFSWTCQYGNSIESFVLFPTTAKIVVANHFSGHISSKINHDKCALQVQVIGGLLVDLTIPIMSLKEGVTAATLNGRNSWNTRRISILNLNAEVGDPGFNDMTVKQLLKCFAAKIEKEEIGNYEWFPIHRSYRGPDGEPLEDDSDMKRSVEYESGGIAPFNCWNYTINGEDIPITDDLMDRIDGSQIWSATRVRSTFNVARNLKDREGLERGPIDLRTSHILALCAAFRVLGKGSTKKSIIQAHGFIMQAKRLSRHSFKVYAHGVYANPPGTTIKKRRLIPGKVKSILIMIAKLNFVRKTHAGYLSLIDENIFKFQRTLKMYSFVATEGEYTAVSQRVASTIALGTEFCFGKKNCAKTAQDIVEEGIRMRLPPVFEERVKNLDFPFPLNYESFRNLLQRTTAKTGLDKSTQGTFTAVAHIAQEPEGNENTIFYPPNLAYSVDRNGEYNGAAVEEEIVDKENAAVA